MAARRLGRDEDPGMRQEGLRDGSPWVELDGAGFAIDGVPLLQDVTLTAGAGEVLALVGPNGAGKSTTLSLLAGDISPTSGTVRVAGRAPRDWPPQEIARHRSVMTQHHDPAFSFTVREMVALGRSPHPVREDDDELIDEALVAAEVEDLAGRDVTTLSGGELARTVFARTLAQHTPVLLLDEPTAALDLRHQELLLSRCHRLAAAGCCVLVVLHDLSLAARHCDRIAMFDAGHLVAVGSPEEVLDPERITAVYRQRVTILSHPDTGRPLVVPL